MWLVEAVGNYILIPYSLSVVFSGLPPSYILESRPSCLKPVPSGVPQRSVLGRFFFLIYTADLPRVTEHHGFHLHLPVDDTQVCDFCSPSSTDLLQLRLYDCIDDVACWVRSNRQQLNIQKTEVLWCTSNRRQHLPWDPIRTGSDCITPSIVSSSWSR